MVSLQRAHLKRYKDIAWLFFKYGGMDLVRSTNLEEYVEAGSAADAGAAPKATELAADLEKLGPTFVKIGQLLSTRPDLLPMPYIEALARLQDQVEPFPYSEVEMIVQEELGVRLSKAFAEFDTKPVAAASLGQVHHAVMRDGRDVAVKVQRPKIREEVLNDLAALEEVAKFLDQHTKTGRRYELGRMLEEFRTTLLRELDYRREAMNLLTLRKNLAEFTRIVVPCPIDDFTTARVLTMEYVEGHKVTALSPVVRTEMNGPELAEELFQAYLKQILVDGFFHADPHPGNAKLTPDGCLAIMDLGMVGRVSPRLRDNLLQVLLAVSEGRGEDAAQTILLVSERREDFDEARFLARIDDVVGQNQESTLEQIAVGRSVMELARAAGECGVRAPSALTMLGKTLLNLDLLASTLSPDFNPNEAIRRHATSIMRRRLTSSLTPGHLFAGMMDAKEFMQNLPARVNKILDAVATNNFKVTVDALDEDRLMSGFQKVANRITLGLILAALIVGAALLARIDTSYRILGYPALATVFFLLAAAGGIALAIQIVFYDDRPS